MESIHELLKKINKFEETVGQTGYKSPHFVAIGSQSSGKSSLLVKIIGRDILPRGVNIVTRRPLVLNIRKHDSSNPSELEWAEFGHLPGKKIYEADQICEAIRVATSAAAGNDKCISSTPILLSYYSNNLPELTFVDLPGLSNVSVGKQPSDTPKLIESIVMEYIQKPDSIILAISPVNDDLANSDSLRLALKVDKNRERTIGIITKFDLADKMLNCDSILRGDRLSLKHGYYAVVNRNQKDTIFNKALASDYAYEAEFFANSPKLASVIDRCGSKSLQKALADIVKYKILECLPKIKKTLVIQTKNISDEIAKLSTQENNSQDKKGFFKTTIYSNLFLIKRIIQGHEVLNSNLHAGAMAYEVIQEFLNTSSKAQFDSFLIESELKFAMLNTSAINGPFSLSPSFYINVMRKPLKFLETLCLDTTSNALSKFELIELPTSQNENSNRINQLIYQNIIETVKEHKQKVAVFIQNLYLTEYNFVNFYDNNFKSKFHYTTDYEKNSNHDVKKALSVYFDIVKESYMDLIPKTVIKQVNSIMECVELKLLNLFQDNQLIENTVLDGKNVSARLSELKAKQKSLEAIKTVVNSIK